ncbi:acyltransferase family protein [Microbacterium sp. P04]|uniref:acyltransferase family protein n=1 Tax=Microbacterium sp. P04 TaxID=3366947 RepID=UPI0037467F8C
MTDPSPRTPSRRDVQGLRALAVIGVVLAHAIGWPRGGFAGVDVFFVVSGFLITGLLLREIAATGTISLADFFARRIRRILPAALLVLLAVVGAAFLVFNRVRADQTLGDAIAAALLVSNWRFAAEGTDYFHAGEALSPLQHFWSLSVEEQYYLVWPALLLLMVLCVPAAARKGRRSAALVGVAALVVVVASAGWAATQTAADPTVAYFSTATRAWELGVGALVAVAAPVLARIPALLRGLLGWVGLAGVVWSFLVIDPETMPFPAPWAALPVGAAALVLAGGIGGDPRVRHLFPLTNPVSVFIGDISYSLYLWHFPVIVFAAVLLPEGELTLPIVFVTIGVLTIATYFGLEQPLHRSPWLRRRGVAAPAGAAPAVETPHPVSGETDAGAPRVLAPHPPTRVASAAAAAPARTIATRPAGWVPGSRYYPGSRPRPADPSALPTPAPLEAAPVHEGVAAPTSPAAQHPPVTTPERPQPVTTPARDATPADSQSATSAWAAWRARYAAQWGLSAATLGIGAGVVVLLVLIAFGSPSVFPAPGAPVAGGPVEVTDPTGAVQAELAAAVSATAWPDLRPSLDQVIATSSSDNPAHDCFSPDVAAELSRCTWGSANAPRHMYLVGDSTAMAYAPAFKKLAEESGGAWRITTVGLYGCRFTDVLVENSGAGVMAACPGRKSDVAAMIAADPADLVVLSNAYTLARSADGRALSASDLISASRAEMAAFGVTGRTVYLAPPPRGGALANCYSPLSSPADCLTGVDDTWHQMASVAQTFAAPTGDYVIDSRPFTCWEEACPAFAGGLPLRYDESHFTVAYSEHIAPVLRWQLAGLGVL